MHYILSFHYSHQQLIVKVAKYKYEKTGRKESRVRTKPVDLRFHGGESKKAGCEASGHIVYHALPAEDDWQHINILLVGFGDPDLRLFFQSFKLISISDKVDHLFCL